MERAPTDKNQRLSVEREFAISRLACTHLATAYQHLLPVAAGKIDGRPAGSQASDRTRMPTKAQRWATGG